MNVNTHDKLDFVASKLILILYILSSMLACNSSVIFDTGVRGEEGLGGVRGSGNGIL